MNYCVVHLFFLAALVPSHEEAICLRVPSPSASTTLHSVMAIGDSTGDNRSDIAAAWTLIDYSNDGSVGFEGKVILFSGATGEAAWEVKDRQGYGRHLALAGDLNSDGIEDLAAAAPAVPSGEFGDFSEGFVDLLCGRSGQRIRRIGSVDEHSLFAWGIASGGDLNQDGVPDLIVASRRMARSYVSIEKPGRRHFDYISIVSGKDGQQLGRWQAPTPMRAFGTAGLTVVDDVDGDAIPDVAIGSPDEHSRTYKFLWMRASSWDRAGKVRVLSGQTGSMIGELAGPRRHHWGSKLVSLEADINGDHLNEVAVSSSPTSEGGGRRKAYVELRSGAIGAPLFRWDGKEPDDRFGEAFCLVKGLSYRNQPVLAIGAPGRNEVEVVSSLGKRLVTIRGDSGFGSIVTAAGDVNGDGIGDLAVASGRTGPVLVYSGAALVSGD